MRIIEAIPYRDFWEKIRITKKYAGKAKVEVYDGYVYIEKKEKKEMVS